VRRQLLVSLGVFWLLGGLARAQSASAQIWGNVILDFPRGQRLLYEIDFEPKAQFSGDDTWRGIDIDPTIEFSPNRWVELVSELNLARTKQSNDVSSWEVSPRIGARFHFLNNLRTMLPGRYRLGRVGIANFSRFEWRNLWYSDDTDPSHQTRFRNRVELKIGLNHADMSLDQTLYLIADYEIFVPLSDDIPERFASKARLRTGLGYRRDKKWRFEVLYIRDGTRQTEGGSFETSANIVNFRMKLFF
jgi:Protein of unknown function (DUF2490)